METVQKGLKKGWLAEAHLSICESLSVDVGNGSVFALHLLISSVFLPVVLLFSFWIYPNCCVALFSFFFPPLFVSLWAFLTPLVTERPKVFKGFYCKLYSQDLEFKKSQTQICWEEYLNFPNFVQYLQCLALSQTWH